MSNIQIAVPKTWWNLECYDRFGILKWKSLNNPNLVTNEGKNHALNVLFHGTTAISPWYFFLFEDDYTPLVTNTYAVPGCTETTSYDEATRLAFVESAASGQSMSNLASKAVFTFNAGKTIYGGGLLGGGTGAADKADTAGGGVLYSSAKFTESKPVVSTDVLKVWITLTA